MSNPVMGGTILSDSLGHEESLEELNQLTDLVGPDIAMGMVSNPAVAQPVKQITTSVANSTSNSASDMPSDISDLRSSDLLQNLSGVDIDKMFEEVSHIIEYLPPHSVWKSQKKSHSTLRAQRATFTFWVDKS